MPEGSISDDEISDGYYDGIPAESLVSAEEHRQSERRNAERSRLDEEEYYRQQEEEYYRVMQEQPREPEPVPDEPQPPA
jgi:hypothetical protein